MKPIYRILIAVGAVIVLVAAGYFIWWLFIDGPAPEVPTQGGALPPETDNTSVSTSTAPDGSTLPTPRPISDHKAFDYWLMPETGEIYYLTPEGYVYAVKDGPDLEISKQAITALNRAEPSVDGRRVLVSFGNPSEPQWTIFDSVDSVWRPLAREIINAGWGKTPSELVASVTSGSDHNLSFVDISRTPPVYTTIIRNFHMKDVLYSMLRNGEILISERPSASFKGSVWRLNPTTRVLTLILAPAAGRTVKTERGADLSYLSDTEEFAIAGGALQSPAPLFFRTLPDKCAAGAGTIYCFVPRNLNISTALPDDYLMRAFYSIDSLYAVTYPSLTLRPIILGEGAFDTSRVRANENVVYFIDRYTDKLYELEIK